MNLGDKLIKLRKDNKMSQEQFAEEICVTRQTVSNWENYKNYPDISTIVKISDIFNISLDVLLKGDSKMINDIDTKVKNSKKYRNILIIICSIFCILIISFSIYFINYNNIKKDLENRFENALKSNDFTKNKDGYYSLKFTDEITYGVPNQKMPSLLEFSLNFHNMVIYCDVNYKDGRHLEATWNNYNDYIFSIEKDDIIIGSSSNIEDIKDVNKLSEELDIDKDELKMIIDKGNKLYKEFYKL